MLKNFILLIILCFSNQSIAQVVVSGKVIDYKTKQGLEGFSIYINNSTSGTRSDDKGNFELTSSTPGRIELIISHLNYEKKAVVIDVSKTINVIVEVSAKKNTLKEVVIVGKKTSKHNIRNWTELFSTLLIGNYKGVSSQCKIKNPEVLYFDYNEQTKQLHVFAKRPLLIENPALGYLVRIELDNFVYAFKTDDAVYKYSVFFEDLVIPESKMQQIAHKRKQLYLGSNMHFMRSLFSNTLDSAGFSIYKYKAIQNLERARVFNKVLAQIEHSYVNQSNPVIDINKLFSNKDSVMYYNATLALDPVLKFDTVKLSLNQVSSPNKDWTLVNFNAKDTLMIGYLGNKVKGTDVTLKTQFEANSQVYKYRKYKEEKTYYLKWYSYMYFFNKEGINIQSNGYYPELGLFVYGEMGNRKLAGQLPFDYYPKEEL